MMWIAICLVLAAYASLSIPAVPVHAQSSPSFDSLQIDLWPEFDKQAMLVIYQANLSPDTELPANVSLPIPDGITPSAVAQGEADGRLVDVDYTLTQDNGRQLVNVQVNSKLAWLEFYQDLTLNGTQRTYNFQWPGGISLPAMMVRIQNPPGISSLTLTPPSTAEVVGQYGLTYKEVNLGAVGPSDRPSIEVSYTKSGQGLTIDSLQSTPTDQTQAPVGSAPEPGQVVVWVVAGLVVVLAAVVGGLYFRVWRPRARPQASRRRHRPRSRPKATKQDSPQGRADGQVYCHECGTLAAADDRYCRSCGTRIRR
jgi:hypothetical protein